MKSLLVQDPSQRLAMRPGGIENIKRHAWYAKKDFDWTAMMNQTLSQPWQPKVKSNEDVSNFKQGKPTPKQFLMKYQDDGSGWDKDF